MKKLTDKQKQIYDFIVEHWSRYGTGPTKAHICNRFGFRSMNSVDSHLIPLIQKGAVEMSLKSIAPIGLIDEVKAHVAQNYCA